MFEMHIQISAPELLELADAINRMADALNAQTDVIRGCQPENEPKITIGAPELARETAVPAEPAPAPAVIPTATTSAVAPAAPVAQPEAPSAPAAAKISLNDIMRAGQLLMDSGKQDELLSLLPKYGVLAVSQLKPEQYDTFVAELRALGAKI